VLGIGEAGIAISAGAVIITVLRVKPWVKSNGNGTCPLHGDLVEDIREIKQDVKELIKGVAKMEAGRNI
jgi:hypothetical protein